MGLNNLNNQRVPLFFHLKCIFKVYLTRNLNKMMFVCLFVALRPKSTAMVIAGGSVHLTTLFPGQA